MSTRSVYLSGFIATCVLLVISLYLQHVEGMQPCTLCLLQRFAFLVLSILFCIGWFVHKQFLGRIIVNSLATLTSVIGIFLAGRQIYIQYIPLPSGNECGMSLQFMLKALPLHEVIQRAFQGSVECSEKGWEFLHLNMAEWGFTWFILFLILSFYLFLKEFGWHPPHRSWNKK